MYQVFFRAAHRILSRFNMVALPATFVMMILMDGNRRHQRHCAKLDDGWLLIALLDRDD